jgi:hypothetical protein
VVDVNLQAFLARSLTVPVRSALHLLVPPDPPTSLDATVTNSVHEAEGMEPLTLVKRMELGLQQAIQVRHQAVDNIDR